MGRKDTTRIAILTHEVVECCGCCYSDEEMGSCDLGAKESQACDGMGFGVRADCPLLELDNDRWHRRGDEFIRRLDAKIAHCIMETMIEIMSDTNAEE